MSGELMAPKPHDGAVIVSENIAMTCSDDFAESTIFDWQTITAQAIEGSGGLVGHIKALLFGQQQTIMISCVGGLPSISRSPAFKQLDQNNRLTVTIIVFGISKPAARRYLVKLKNLLTGHK